MANCFKATCVSLVSCNTGGMSFSRDLFNLRAVSRISFFSVLGHVDFVRKESQRFGYSLCSCFGLVDSMASIMIR